MRFKSLPVLLVLPVAFVACSGGGSGSSSSGGGSVVTPGSSISSQFIDSPVKGLTVEKASGNGLTGNNGIFTCSAGEEIKFKLKDLEIGSASCGEKIYISDVTPFGVGGDTGALAQLIQSLSINSGSQLDLTTFNSSAIVVSGLNLGDIDNELDGLNLADSGLAKITRAAADSHVLANLPTPSNQSALEALALEGANLITLNGASANGEDCWDKVSGIIEVAAIAGKDGAYRMNISKYIGHDSTVTATADLDCDEYGNPGAEYECNDPEISKVITGNSLNLSKFTKIDYSKDVGNRIGCISSDKEDFYMVDQTDFDCSSYNGYENVNLLTAFSDTLSYGYTFGVMISTSKLSISFKEQNVEVAPVESSFQENGTGPHGVNIAKKTYSCNYSYSTELDAGSSN